MANRRIVVLDPSSPSPIFGDAENARIVEMPAKWAGDGPALRKALDSGLLVENRVGKAVGKKSAEEIAEAPAEPAKPAPKPPTPAKK